MPHFNNKQYLNNHQCLILITNNSPITNQYFNNNTPITTNASF